MLRVASFVPWRDPRTWRRRQTWIIPGDSASAQELLCNFGHALRLEPEFPLEFLQRRRGPKRGHSDHAALRTDISLPSERGSLLDRDPRSDIRREDAVAVLLGLMLEDFPGGHRDYPGTDPLGEQLFMSIHGDADLAARSDEDNLRIAA